MAREDTDQNSNTDARRDTFAMPHGAAAALPATVPRQLISFAVGDEQYGVDIVAVREIRSWSAVTPLPGQAPYVRGVVNLRDTIVPIIDLRCRFGLGRTEATALHVVVVVVIGSVPIGLLADRVLDIVPVDKTRIHAIPDVGAVAAADFLGGMVTTGDTMIALIDLPNLIPSAAELAACAIALH